MGLGGGEPGGGRPRVPLVVQEDLQPLSSHPHSHHSIHFMICTPTCSVVEPEPDFLGGAGAGEKAPAPGCCCLARGTVVAK